jgi:hypothetical protein
MAHVVNLPGIEGGIPELEEAAAAYADIRDQRIALNRDEANLKADLLRLMHEHKKTIYQRGNVTITIVQEEETVKVRVRKAVEDGDDDTEDADDAPHATA